MKGKPLPDSVPDTIATIRAIGCHALTWPAWKLERMPCFVSAFSTRSVI